MHGERTTLTSASASRSVRRPQESDHEACDAAHLPHPAHARLSGARIARGARWRSCFVLLRAGRRRCLRHVFEAGFEAVTDAPASDAEAARFLTMATFGPTAAPTSRICARSATGSGSLSSSRCRRRLQRPYVEALDAGRARRQARAIACRRGSPMRSPRPTSCASASRGRCRRSWSSQIASSHLGQDPIALAEYNDVLARDSLRLLRQPRRRHAPARTTSLLYDVTRSPAMAKMLTFLRNKKGDAALGTSPDENYAREVMQLFSIGLDPAQSRFLAGARRHGNPIATYDQAWSSAYANVFTGWSYASGFNSESARRQLVGGRLPAADLLRDLSRREPEDAARQRRSRRRRPRTAASPISMLGLAAIGQSRERRAVHFAPADRAIHVRATRRPTTSRASRRCSPTTARGITAISARSSSRY